MDYDKDYDIYRDKIFDRFMFFLKEIKDLNKNGNYEEIREEKISELNKYIYSVIWHSQEELKSLQFDQKKKYLEFNQNEIEEINGEIELFLKRFFNCFKKKEDSFQYLFTLINQLYRKRVYQLNHFRGYFEGDLNDYLDKKPIFKCYIHLNLFLDYYESFALFLKPSLAKLWGEKRKSQKIRARFNYKSSDLYQYLFPSFFKTKRYSFIFDYKLRNQTAHNNYLINPENYSFIHYKLPIFFPKDVNKIEKKEKIQKLYIRKTFDLGEIEQKYKMISNLVIWFTTYFDIIVNETMANLVFPSIEANWSNYFEEYIQSWEVYHKHVWNASQSM